MYFIHGKHSIQQNKCTDHVVIWSNIGIATFLKTRNHYCHGPVGKVPGEMCTTNHPQRALSPTSKVKHHTIDR